VRDFVCQTRVIPTLPKLRLDTAQVWVVLLTYGYILGK
jgi:hypothetical protein